MGARDPLEVMITVDVEAWPRCPDWRAESLAGDLARDIYGATPDGDFGIKYQVDVLRRHGLKGVFFVEALMASEIGIDPLSRIVEDIQEAGSEVQLHIHTEWFEKMTTPFFGDKRAYNIRELTRDEQVQVIETAMENLSKAGAESVIAYGLEMQAAMEAAYHAAWTSFVIVSHSFELLRDRKLPQPHAHPDWSVIHRFDALCEFLADNQSQYRTVGFLDLDGEPDSTPVSPLEPPMAASTARTAARMASQALRRLPRKHEARLRKTLARVGLEKL